MSDLALVAEERIEQILDAAVICIAKLGLDGATLDQIAAQAGIARGHLRHFVGNRDELMGRVGEHLLDRYVVALSEAAGEAPDRSAGQAVVSVLFGPGWRPAEDNPAREPGRVRDDRLAPMQLGAALTSDGMANRLVTSTSPYLRQHAENPDDWYSWGEEAFAEAKRRDTPILLSVGYAACHWRRVAGRSIGRP